MFSCGTYAQTRRLWILSKMKRMHKYLLHLSVLLTILRGQVINCSDLLLIVKLGISGFFYTFLITLGTISLLLSPYCRLFIYCGDTLSVISISQNIAFLTNPHLLEQ